ncbi:MAG TPA: HEAT repeat domain-containing protein, partial [Planctomycetaceae bacterium]|nr:HEAT repeat domain-containing protein [Planctomycetaceae bacterium]
MSGRCRPGSSRRLQRSNVWTMTVVPWGERPAGCKRSPSLCRVACDARSKGVGGFVPGDSAITFRKRDVGNPGASKVRRTGILPKHVSLSRLMATLKRAMIRKRVRWAGAFLVVAGFAPYAVVAQSAWQHFSTGLQSAVARVRVTAAGRLGELRAKRAVPLLIDALGDEVAEVRAAAARALGQIRDSRAVRPLVAALRDPDPNVRFYAAWALGELKDERAVDGLVAALEDPEWPVRDQAAWALREVRSPSVLRRLIDLLAADGDRRHVGWLIRQLAGEQLGQVLEPLLRHERPHVRLRAWRLLRESAGRLSSEQLRRALEDDAPQIRLFAVRELTAIGKAASRKLLLELLEREPDAAVRRAATKAVEALSPLRHLRAWWSFDEAGDGVAKDRTGHGNDGKVLGCTVVEGRIGKALQFDGRGYVELGRPANLP